MSLDFSVFSQDVSPESIKSEMVAKLAAQGLDVDTRAGSYTDLLFSEAAYRLYLVWQQFATLLAAAVPGEGSGPYLDKFGAQYGITRTPAATAYVEVTFSGSDGAVIPAGTVVQTTSGLRFATLLAAQIEDGTATVSAIAQEAGSQYNVEAGTIDRFLLTVPGVTEVTNLEPGAGGADAEGDAAYYGRIHTRLSEPVASGNPAYYEQLALEVPGVGQAKTIPLWDGPGTAKVVVASADKQPLDEITVEAVQQKMEEWRIIGADITAVSAAALTITVSAQCTLDAGTLASAVEDELEERLAALFQELPFGTTDPVRYNQVALQLLSCAGVVDYASLTLNGAAANVTKTAEQVPVLGTVTITAAGGG